MEDCTITPPTPTPTPVPVSATPTPTPSPTPNACYEYVLENENPYPVSVGYTDCCNGAPAEQSIGAFQIAVICSTTTPTGSAVINPQDYPCSVPCPSQTPTPSVTPTITPSTSGPALCETCYFYTITNTGEEPLQYEYYPCGSGIPNYGFISQQGGQAVRCACNGSVIITDGVGTIGQGEPCV